VASEQDKGASTATQDQNLKEREALNDAYAALLGQQTTQSFVAFTFEEAMDAQIEAIEGKATTRRPNELGRVDAIEQRAIAAVATLKTIPPEKFVQPDATRDVNTPRDGEGT
jgi:hypothetical protein